MRVPKPATPKKEVKLEKDTSARDERLAVMAVDSAQQAANAARETAEIARMALESDNHNDIREALSQMAKAITAMSAALNKKQSAIRVIPKRDSRGIATSYDIIPIVKKVH